MRSRSASGPRWMKTQSKRRNVSGSRKKQSELVTSSMNKSKQIVLRRKGLQMHTKSYSLVRYYTGNLATPDDERAACFPGQTHSGKSTTLMSEYRCNVT